MAAELDRQRKTNEGISAALVKQYREALAQVFDEAPMRPGGDNGDDNKPAAPVDDLARYRVARGAEVGDTAQA